MLTCSKCKEVKPETFFYKDRHRPTGRMSQCKICNNLCRTTHARSNRDKSRIAFRRWYSANKSDAISRSMQWHKDNTSKVRAHAYKSRYPERNLTPAWADYTAMQKFYDEARNLTESTGVLHDVDHIIPINGTTACGLHTQHNLQVIPRLDNIRKGNSL